MNYQRVALCCLLLLLDNMKVLLLESIVADTDTDRVHL